MASAVPNEQPVWVVSVFDAATQRELLDLAPALLWVDRGDGHGFLNQACLDFFGRCEEDLLQNGWINHCHLEDREQVLAAYQLAVESGSDLASQARFRRGDGEYRWLRSRGESQFDDDGNLLGFIGSSLDVTEQIVAEERGRGLEQQNRAVQDAQRRKDQFLAVLSHELRNFLAPMGYAVHLMQISADDPAEVRERCAAMDRQLVQMVRVVDDLLDVSRIARGKMELRRERVSLATVVANAVETSRPWIEAGEQKLDIALPAEPVHLDADPARLAQVVANLLNNASKYTPPGGEIRLTVETDGPDAVIRVADSGMGIPAPELLRIFDIFSQVNPALNCSRSGLGIGLALAKGIVELHDGSITARSDGPQQGSEFVVRLPV